MTSSSSARQPNAQVHFVVRARLEREFAAMCTGNLAREAQAQAAALDLAAVRRVASIEPVEEAPAIGVRDRRRRIGEDDFGARARLGCLDMDASTGRAVA